MFIFTCVRWYLLSVDDDIRLRGHRGYSAIFSSQSLIQIEALERDMWCAGEEGKAEGTRRRRRCTGRSRKQGN